MTEYRYIGSEQEYFAIALKWKSYWISFIGNYLRGDVLEVGAGQGNNTRLLNSERFSKWICLEPDNVLVGRLSKYLKMSLLSNYEIINGSINSLRNNQLFDSILYIDVLEHIKDDKEELKQASNHLKSGGHIIIISPGLPIIYSEFDKAIGHFRRYTKKSIKKIFPDRLKVDRLIYMDSVGLFLSLANRFLLKQKIPSLNQIKIWDRYIIPCSKLIDPLTRYCIGKSILAVLTLEE